MQSSDSPSQGRKVVDRASQVMASGPRANDGGNGAAGPPDGEISDAVAPGSPTGRFARDAATLREEASSEAPPPRAHRKPAARVAPSA